VQPPTPPKADRGQHRSHWPFNLMLYPPLAIGRGAAALPPGAPARGQRRRRLLPYARRQRDRSVIGGMMLRRWGAGAASQFWIGLISRRNVQESTASCYHWLRAPRPMPSAFLLGSTSSRASAISCSASSNKPCNAISARCWDSGIRRWPRSASGDETRAPHDFPVCVRLQDARRSLFRYCRGRDVARRNREISHTRGTIIRTSCFASPRHPTRQRSRSSRSSSKRTGTSRSISRRCRPSPGSAPEACTGSSRRTGVILRRISPSGSGSTARRKCWSKPRKSVGDPDRAEMRLPEPRPFRP